MSSGYDEFVARVKQNILHETIYTDSEGRTIVVIVMEDLFSQFSLKSHVQDERPRQTRRQQLIRAGIPAHELDGITGHRLDEPADGTPNEALADAFRWGDSPQGSEHWEKWESLLN